MAHNDVLQAFVSNFMEVLEMNLLRKVDDVEEAESFYAEMVHLQPFDDKKNFFGYKNRRKIQQ